MCSTESSREKVSVGKRVVRQRERKSCHCLLGVEGGGEGIVKRSKCDTTWSVK